VNLPVLRHHLRTLLPFWRYSLAEVRCAGGGTPVQISAVKPSPWATPALFQVPKVQCAPSHAGAHPSVAVPHPPPHTRTGIGRRSVVSGVVAIGVWVGIWRRQSTADQGAGGKSADERAGTPTPSTVPAAMPLRFRRARRRQCRCGDSRCRNQSRQNLPHDIHLDQRWFFAELQAPPSAPRLPFVGEHGLNGYA
jgi:hypothetical protein